MRIERVEIFGVSVPLAGVYTTAYESRTQQKSAIVRITTSDGLVGLGNVDPVPGYSEETVEQTLTALQKTLTPPVIDLDPRNIHAMLAVLNETAPGFFDAKAAIEMACVDLAARSMQVSATVYLGGAVRNELHLNGWIGIVTPAEAAHQAAEWKRRGFISAKIKAGGNIEKDRDRVKAVREAVGADFGIRVDANAGYDSETAIRLAQLIAPFDIQLLEQPVPADDLAGMGRVRREGAGIPIMADESIVDHESLIRVIRAEAADMIKVKVMKQGGMFSTRRMLATAEAAGMRCVIGHGFGLGINTMAELTLAATASNVLEGLECVGPLNLGDDVVSIRPDFVNGRTPVPTGNGLGVELDNEKVRRYQTSFADVR